jgi:hypothetical protein
MQPPKRKTRSNTSVEDVTAGEPPQKRKKYDNMPEPGDVVDDMERLMNIINSILPEYAITPSISEVPQDLLERGISPEKVEAQLGDFKYFCQIRLRQIRRDMRSPSNLTPEEGSYFDLWRPFILNIFQKNFRSSFLRAIAHSPNSFRRRTVSTLCCP